MLNDEERKEFTVRQDWRGRLILRIRHFDNFVHSGQWQDASQRICRCFLLGFSRARRRLRNDPPDLKGQRVNGQVLSILAIIETTCAAHRIDMSKPEQETLAQMCWLNAAGDKDKIIDYLRNALSVESKRTA